MGDVEKRLLKMFLTENEVLMR